MCSPDTDVYHIGLPLVSDQSCEVYVRISMFSSQENRFLNLKSLCSAVRDDPDLACIPKDILPKLLQMLFICTGCDYISFFSGFGKSTFLKIFFQHAEFISGMSVSTLADTCSSNRHLGFLSFIRLVGTAYFKKYFASFKYSSPRALFNSKVSCDSENQHKEWLDCIRCTVWECIEFEDQLPLSWDALWRHWLHCCWVAHFWSQAADNSYNLLPLQKFGWKVENSTLLID